MSCPQVADRGMVPRNGPQIWGLPDSIDQAVLTGVLAGVDQAAVLPDGEAVRYMENHVCSAFCAKFGFIK